MARKIDQPVDVAVASVAVRQHGNVTRAQLLALGLTDDGIAHRVQRGRLFRIHQGVFSVGRIPHTPLERASAAVLACGDGALLSHAGALALWGLTNAWPHPFEVTVTQGKRVPAGIVVHRCRGLTRADIANQLGIRATSLARTLLDCAPGTDPQRITRLVNDALLSPYLTESQLGSAVARFARHPGAALIRPLITDSPGVTKSELEDCFLEFCATYGLPRPLVNVRVAGHEVDALFVAERVIVELDGRRYHRSDSTFETDRDRDADTLQAGYPTVRITHRRLTTEPAREAARLHSILEQRRRSHITPPP